MKKLFKEVVLYIIKKNIKKGNAHYKLSNIGPSIYYYEKALELSPSDGDIKNKITFDGWAWFAVCCVVLFVVLFILYYSARTSLKKRLFFISSWLILVFGLFGVFFAFRQYGAISNNQFAIIFAQETTIKSEPNLRSEEVFQLHEGSKVQVTETVNNWKKIKLSDGKIGWIPAMDLKEL